MNAFWLTSFFSMTCLSWDGGGVFRIARKRRLSSTSCVFMAPAVGLVWYCVIRNPTWIAFSSGKPLHIKHDGAIMMFGLQMPLDSDKDHAYNKRPYSFPSKEMVSIKLIAYKDNVHHQSCTYVNLCIHLGQWSYHGQRCLQLQRRHISHLTNH